MANMAMQLVWTGNGAIVLKMILPKHKSGEQALTIPLPFTDMPTATAWLDEHMPAVEPARATAIAQVYADTTIFGTGAFQGGINFGGNNWADFLTQLDSRMRGYDGEPHSNDDYILKISPNPYHHDRPQWDKHQAECRRYAESVHTTFMPA